MFKGGSFSSSNIVFFLIFCRSSFLLVFSSHIILIINISTIIMILKYHHGYHEHRHQHNLPPHHDHNSSSSPWCLDVQICNGIPDTSWWHVCLACWRLLCPPNPPHSHWQITVEKSESYNESPPKKVKRVSYWVGHQIPPDTKLSQTLVFFLCHLIFVSSHSHTIHTNGGPTVAVVGTQVAMITRHFHNPQ